MKRMHPFYLAAALVVTPACQAGGVTQTSEAASLEIRWDGDEPTLGLADLLTVTLLVEGAEPLATPTAPLQLAGDAKWQLVQRSAPDRKSIAGQRERWRLVYRFAPREPGNIAFTFPPVKYQTSDGAEHLVTWKPVSFVVKTPEPGELHGDGPGIEAMPPLPPSDQAWLIYVGVAGGLIFAAFLVGGWYWFIRPIATRSQEAVALAAWRRLMAKRLHETGRSERFMTLLTLLVRTYLERQHGVPARRRTTAESARAIANCPTLSPEEKQFIIELLHHADAAKFADCELASAECQQQAEAVRRFLEERMQRLK